MSQNKRKQLKSKAVNRLLVPFLSFCSKQPLPRLHRWGRWLGQVLYWMNGRNIQVTRTNLALCYPQLSDDAREQKVRASTLQTANMGLELGWSWMIPFDQLIASVRQVHGQEYLEAAKAEGHGVIILGPHLGNWEVFGLFLSHHYEMTAMYAVPKIDALDKIITDGRSRSGMLMVPASMKGVAKLLKQLQKGELVGNLPDQEPDDPSGGVFAPFMGVEAFSPKLVTRLISKTGARVVAGFARRLPDGQGFDIHFIPADERVYDSDDVVAVSGVNRMVENLVELAPDQYQWEYKRFKRRPEGQPGLYPRRK
ncbi:lysophospholipid acyltransferase family protein [Oceanospirillum sediminis]|uniref:Lysophospholipid acyltransferase family protein n=1 Tax=Oceanospirillum sediminis TaxID=2760088 RepID=A0A839IVG8_9GAMM|nr:lysophospholipid acyltransferase family protein [Oceanospirillum sediminis]MBB1489345.1 lysophospholipid acyltransferase family protein [Oceanospirillum sediminis]